MVNDTEENKNEREERGCKPRPVGGLIREIKYPILFVILLISSTPFFLEIEILAIRKTFLAIFTLSLLFLLFPNVMDFMLSEGIKGRGSFSSIKYYLKGLLKIILLLGAYEMSVFLSNLVNTY